MKRASKILTLILIVVFVLSVFAGCDLVGRDVAKYRATTVMSVGNQEISIGKLLDTFNSYYNSYYYYISAGYIDAEYLVELVINSLMRQYIQIDDYVTRHKDNPVRPDITPEVKNAQFLTAEQFAYCVQYVKFSSFTSFDSTVLTILSVKHEIGDATSEDTSRDFTEYDELLDSASYAEHLLKQSFVSEDADEYFEKYYASGSVDFSDMSKLISDYVYTDLNEDYKAILDELNERLEDEEDEITLEEYQQAQQKAVSQYRDSIKNNYGIELEDFMLNQVADMVSSAILSLWSYEHYADIAQDEDFVKSLQDVDETFARAQKERFAFNDDFDAFITSLSNNSFIYDVPEDMQGKYVFVKNILIPFTSQQTALLNAQSSHYGGTETAAYIRLRNELATEIIADYFDNDKYDEAIESKYFSDEKWFTPSTDEDSERKYEKLTDLFVVENNNVAINPDGVLGQFFKENGVVAQMEGTDSISETIVELMKRFNTDVGQHTTRYDYVVYVGKDWEDYSHSWVKEFYTAVNELGHDSEGNFLEENIGKYAMCVSSYGVHIIYVENFVEEYTYTFDNVNWSDATAWNDTTSLYYVRYKAEFESKVSDVTDKAFEELEAKYLDEGKVSVTNQLKRFLKDNDFSFDFDEFLKERREELR